MRDNFKTRGVVMTTKPNSQSIVVNKALAREYSVNFLVGDCVLLAYILDDVSVIYFVTLL